MAVLFLAVLAPIGWVDGHVIYQDHNPAVRIYAGTNFVIFALVYLWIWTTVRLNRHTKNRIVLDFNERMLEIISTQAATLQRQYSIQGRLMDIIAKSGRGDLVMEALRVVFEGEQDGKEKAGDATPGEPARGGNDGGRTEARHARGERRRKRSGEDSPVSGSVLPGSGHALRDGGADAD